MAATPPPVELGTPAPDFRLLATDDRTYRFTDVAGRNGTVIVQPLSLRQSSGRPNGYGCPRPAQRGHRACANLLERCDVLSGRFVSHMQRFARTHGFPFPYLHD